MARTIIVRRTLGNGTPINEKINISSDGKRFTHAGFLPAATSHTTQYTASERAATPASSGTPSNVSLVYTNSATPYMDSYKKTETKLKSAKDKELESAKSARSAYRKQAEDLYNRNVTDTNSNYDASGRQNYINYMQSQKNLPDQLNALGIRGGASESSLIRLGNTYGTNVASNESSRNEALTGLKRNYNDSLSDYDTKYQETIAGINKEYDDKIANAFATAYANQITWEKEKQQKDLEYFSGVVEGLYGTTAEYDALIKNLAASSDPNKNYKIMLARKAKQTLIDKLKEEAEAAAASSYSGGGGYSGGGYSGGGYSYDGGGDGYDAGAIATGVRDYVANVAKQTAGSFKPKTRTIKGDTYYVNSNGSYARGRKNRR